MKSYKILKKNTYHAKHYDVNWLRCRITIDYSWSNHSDQTGEMIKAKEAQLWTGKL